MDIESLKKFLEKGGGNYESSVDSMPSKFLEPFVSHGMNLDLVEPGRILCSFKVPNRLVNAGNFLHGGATATLVDILGSAVIHTVGAPSVGVSLEINVSYLDAAYLGEEIEVEAKVLRVGKTIAAVTVELRKKKTGKIVAQGRHTKYLAVNSKL
ncbi:uncharacterized protein LOC129882398 [Solanum dulcamara]|uniref:uncharacterized protein LOC129882398 n=1 Tax=Solanum dulcamara TaxID=45834 RepID=UPI0024869821|nr:uncharacterized protein LOC129882398 [Solanum dulcamara]